MLKLADWRARREELIASDKPFATVVLAHLAAQQTRQHPASRQRAKLGLVRRLYDRGYSRERVLELFRFIVWLLALPPELEEVTRRTIEQMEEERHMAYITSIERIGHAEGLAEGREEGREEGRQLGTRETLRRLVTLRFGTLPALLDQRISTEDDEGLHTLLERVATAQTLDELE